MIVRIGAFEVELRRRWLYLRLPYVGAMFWRKGRLVFDRWDRLTRRGDLG